MDLTSIYTIIIAIITGLGSTGAWTYYYKVYDSKKKEKDQITDEYKERIEKMEKLLEDASSEKSELREKILELTAEVSKLRVKAEYLEKENQALMFRMGIMGKQPDNDTVSG